MPHTFPSGWPGDPTSLVMGILVDVQRQIGVLQEGQRGVLTAIERVRTETHQRHDRTEERIWQLRREAPASSASPTTESRPGRSLEGLLAVMQHLITILKLALPLSIVTAVIAGKLANPELLPLLRQLLGSQ